MIYTLCTLWIEVYVTDAHVHFHDANLHTFEKNRALAFIFTSTIVYCGFPEVYRIMPPPVYSRYLTATTNGPAKEES